MGGVTVVSWLSYLGGVWLFALLIVALLIVAAALAVFARRRASREVYRRRKEALRDRLDANTREEERAAQLEAERSVQFRARAEELESAQFRARAEELDREARGEFDVQAAEALFLERVRAREQRLGGEGPNSSVGFELIHVTEGRGGAAIEEAAGQRADAIFTFLDQSREVAESSPMFFELPSDLVGLMPERLRLEGVDEWVWHAALLDWQRNAPEYLVVERLVDLLTATAAASSRDRIATGVRLRRVSAEDAILAGFQWRAVVQTRYPEAVAEVVRRHSHWVPIGVDIEPESAMIPFGLCQAGFDGQYGVVGGFVRGEQTVLAITCAHVLSNGCMSLRWPKSLPNGGHYDEGQPDVALIMESSPCFCRQLSPGFALRVPSETEFNEVIGFRDKAVELLPPTRPRQGYVDHTRQVVPPLDGIHYRGPFLGVALNAYSRFGIQFPLFTELIAKPGESGTWIRRAGTADWLGMVVGGDPWTRTTYVLRSDFIMNVVRRSGQMTGSITVHTTGS